MRAEIVLSALLALLIAVPSHAQTFETAGIIDAVRLDHNEITIDGHRYRLPNAVVDSGAPSAGPAIFQLRPGMSVACSGVADGEPLIETLHIHRRSYRMQSSQ